MDFINERLSDKLHEMKSKIEEEIEDIESDLSIFKIVLEILKLHDHNGNTIEYYLIPDNVDDIRRIEEKRDRLVNKLHEKWDEHKKICDRLEEME